MKSLGDHGPMGPSGQTQTSGGNGDDQSAVVGNERLTALAGAVLLVLIVVELMTTAYLRAGLSAHVFVGVVLSGPLAVKIGSTFYRFPEGVACLWEAVVGRESPRWPRRSHHDMGIGLTWEHLAHVRQRRTLLSRMVLGDERAQYAAIAAARLAGAGGR